MYPALDLPTGESDWTQWQRHWTLQRSSETNVSSGRDIQTVTKQQKFRLLTLAQESWSQQKTMQEFSVTKHNGEKLQEGKVDFSWSDSCKESRPVTCTALCRFLAPMSHSPKRMKKNSSWSTVLQFHNFFTSHIWDYVPFYQICLTFTS